MPLDLFHVCVKVFLDRCREEGFSEFDIASLRATIGEMTDRAHARPPPPEAASVTSPGTPSAIRRSSSSQSIRRVVVEDPDGDDE